MWSIYKFLKIIIKEWTITTQWGHTLLTRVPRDRATKHHQIGVSDPQRRCSFRVIHTQHNIKSEWTIHNSIYHSEWSTHNITEQRSERSTNNIKYREDLSPTIYTNIYSEIVSSVNPDQKNRPGRKNVVGFGQSKMVYYSVWENHMAVY